MSIQTALKKQFSFSTQESLFLIFILVLAFILRLWGLGDVGFNTDEAVYAGQAATLAGYEKFIDHFSIYRSHPLLLQFFVSILFINFGLSDTIARIVPVMLGVLTIVLTYFIAKMLYDKRVAMLSALVITIIPYHIIVSRQVLLDMPLSFFFTLTLFFLVRYIKSSGSKGVYLLSLIGASSGLSFLSKEVGFFALIASIACLFFIKKFAYKNLVIVISSFLLVSSPFWIPIVTIEEAQQAALSYWKWQTSREPNHPETFYISIISNHAIGYVLSALCILSIIYALMTRNINKPAVFVLLIWIAVPLLIIQSLDIKGYHFLISLIPPFVLLGVSFLNNEWMKKVSYSRIVIIILIPLIFLSTGPVIDYLFQIPFAHIAGSGGEPYSREGAIWIKNNIPSDKILLTLDVRTANIIKFYANNEVFSLHASMNPAYTKIVNPDMAILSGRIDYIVYEAYLPEQYPYLKNEAEQLNELIKKYDAVRIHTEYETYVENGDKMIKPALMIFSLERNMQ